jgi:hypothetical protein
MVETCATRTGPCTDGKAKSISPPHATAKAATTATTHLASIVEPGSGSVSSNMTAPASHSTPLTRPAKAGSPRAAAIMVVGGGPGGSGPPPFSRPPPL